MFTVLLALAALVGFARADCDACIDGRCYSPKTIVSGFQITDEMAIDRSDNVLYLQLNGNQNVAIFLKDLEIRLINMMKTKGMFMDHESGRLYLGTKDIPGTFYTYNRGSNETIDNLDMYPLYSYVKYYSGYNLRLFGTGEWLYEYLQNFTISSLVVVESDPGKQVFFVSNNTLYLPGYNDQPTIEILRRDHMLLSADKFGDVYIGDATEKVIYKLDKRTFELNIYAAYKTGAVEEFIFEQNNEILFRNVDGSVVHWMPYSTEGPGQIVKCTVEPPSTSFFIRQLETSVCM